MSLSLSQQHRHHVCNEAVQAFPGVCLHRSVFVFRGSLASLNAQIKTPACVRSCVGHVEGSVCVTPFVDGSGERVRVGAGRPNPAFQPPHLRLGTRKP